jgi:single-strand DNA-binding protein
MSLNYNKVTLAGNLTRDPEVKFLAGDRAVASFGLAINRKFKGNDGELKEEVTFVDCEAWGRTAELVGQYLNKGSPCFIEGRLKLDTWDDKKTGEKRSKLMIVAESVQFLGGKKEHDQHGAEAVPAGETIGRDGLRRNPVRVPGGDDDPNNPPF